MSTKPKASEDLMDAKAAMALLGIKPQTLYAYVSRGLIRALPSPGGKGSLYYRQDLEALQMRGRTRSATRNTAERALRIGGGAVLKTSITAIAPEGPRYRGVLATDLAQMGRPFEDCAELLWNGVLPPQSLPWTVPEPPQPFGAFANVIAATAPANNSRRLFALCVEALASCTGAHAEQKSGASVLAARQLMDVLVSAFGFLREVPGYERGRAAEPLAAKLLQSLGAPVDEARVQLVDAALIICADHELAPSTFAARIAASAGADLYSCVSSALGAFEGLYTGLGCDLAEDLLRRSGTAGKYVESLQAITQRKQPLPGYNHPLYPDGDTRATFLLGLLRRIAAGDRQAQLPIACIEAAHKKLKVLPSLNVSLAALALVLRLPPRSPGALMALGRTAGWIAHAYEQRLAGFLVRPRAEYIGPAEAVPR